MEAMDISSVILQKSNDFLRNMLRGAPDEMNIRYFRQLSPVLLENLSEEEKKVFWVNLYNAFVQKELYGMNMDRVDKSIFTRKNINIAGQGLSLDTLEHGFLRGNLWKYSFGYLPGHYLDQTTRSWKCKRLDPRIHFQLNCGAASCPIIRPLSLQTLENELEIGQRIFIESNTEVDDVNCKFVVSSLFLFYFKDFEGMRGIKRLLKNYFPDKPYGLKFSSFDWSFKSS